MGIYRVLGQFNWLVRHIGPIPMLGLGLLTFVLIALLILKPHRRLYLSMFTFVLFTFAIGQRRGIAQVFPTMTTLAASARWVFAFAIAFTGFIFICAKTELKRPATFTLFGLAILLLVAATTAVNVGDAFFRIILLAFFMIGIIAYGFNLATELETGKIMQAWLITSLGMAVLNLVWMVFFPWSAFIYIRFHGITSNPNQYGMLAATMIMPALWYILEEKKYLLLNTALASWWFVSLLMSGSRASLLILIPVGLYIAFTYAKKPLPWFYGGLAALLFIIASQYLMEERLAQRFFETGGAGRYEMWASAWSFVQRQPVFGYGFGWADEALKMNLHNSYLLLLVEIGFIGTIPLIGVLLFLPLRGLSKAVAGNNLSSFKGCRMFAVFLLGMLLNAFFENWIVGVGNVALFTFFLILGIEEGMFASLAGKAAGTRNGQQPQEARASPYRRESNSPSVTGLADIKR